MNWNMLLQYLPDFLCIVVCLVGCISSGRKTGTMKKMLESLCPSVEPVQALELRVNDLEKKLDALLAALEEVKK